MFLTEVEEDGALREEDAIVVSRRKGCLGFELAEGFSFDGDGGLAGGGGRIPTR
jgi:hypothetical protein